VSQPSSAAVGSRDLSGEAVGAGDVVSPRATRDFSAPRRSPEEVAGLAIRDVRFDVEAITFQPHPWHKGGRLKTGRAERTISLWPQLREILQVYLETHRQLRGEVLLPSPHVAADRPLTDYEIFWTAWRSVLACSIQCSTPRPASKPVRPPAN
jgi:integrase